MKSEIPHLLAAFLLLISAGPPACAQAVEEGAATSIPWSGWWWPASRGDLVLGYRGEPGALEKHDQLTGNHAATWEEGNTFHFDPHGTDWWGHCHAWAAAALLEKEPVHDVGLGGVLFHVGDIKGLLSEAHFSDHAIFYGQRFNGNPGDDFQDLHPLQVWYVLRKYINENKTGIVFDLDPGPQVWSYPAYAYRVTYQAAEDGTYYATMSIWVASFQVVPDVLGTVTERHDYTFTFHMKDNQMISGSDQWTGASVQSHPDFAWYPMERAQENPQLDYNFVTQLTSQAH